MGIVTGRVKRSTLSPVSIFVSTACSLGALCKTRQTSKMDCGLMKSTCAECVWSSEVTRWIENSCYSCGCNWRYSGTSFFVNEDIEVPGSIPGATRFSE